MKKLYIAIMLLLGALTVWSQNVEYYNDEKFKIDTALTLRKNYVFSASDEILLDSVFQRNSSFTAPYRHYYAEFNLDRFGVFSPNQGLQGGENEGDNGYVGAIDGVIDVGKLGNAVYAIPIDLPQGVNGMQPKLSLFYNNQAGNGLLGWCWDLAGLSAITRTGMTRYHDGVCGGVTLDDDYDRFMLDGMRLIPCISYGTDSIEFKTEQDEMSRIVAYTSNSNGNTTIYNFRVWKADGTIVEYGFDNEHTHSRIEPQTESDKALCWLENKISDRNGNSIEFYYSSTQATGEYYVQHIDYTSNPNCGIQPAFQVVFQYENNSDFDFCYVGGNILQYKKVLKEISVQRTDGTQHQMVHYLFEYEPKKTGEHNDFYDSINMFKRLGRIALEQDGMAVNPTRIEWSCYGNGIDVLEQERNISPNIYQNFPFVGDFNGDGYSDLAVVPFKGDTLYYPNNIDINIHFNKGGVDSIFYGTPGVSIPNVDKTLDWIYVLDINDDGFDDIITVCYDSIATGDTTKIMVYKNTNGTGFTPAWTQPLWFSSKALITIGDFEGTGKQGFIACALKYVNDTPKLSNFTYVHCENGWCFTDPVNPSNGLGYILGVYQIASGDFGGRGHTDLLFLKENGSPVYGVKKINGDYCFEHRFTNTHINHPIHEGQKWSQVFPGDYNGDGMTDLLFYGDVENSGYWNIFYSEGTGFSQPVHVGNLSNTYLPNYELYGHSLRKVIAYPDLPHGRSYGICPADFDGDGLTDIAVLGYENSYSSIDIYFRFKPKLNNPNEASSQSIFQSTWYNGIYGPHGNSPHYFTDYYYFGCHSQYLHIGTFKKKGNASFLCLESREDNAYNHKRRPGVFTFKSARDLNNVKSITDGMGNKIDLSYKWQMQPYAKYQYGVTRLAVPMHVMDCHTTYTISGKPKQIRYSYYDLCYHKDGHGFLGYKKTVKTSVENEEKVGQTISCYSLEPMNEYALLLPVRDSVFVYLNENKVLSNTTHYTFKRAFDMSSNGLKAGCPALIQKQIKHFNIENGGTFLYKEIMEYTYNFAFNNDMYNYSYYNYSYACDTTKSGISANNVSHFSDCEFRTTESVVYSQNNHFNWIINRPEQRTFTQSMVNKPDIVKSTIINYASNDTYLPDRITEIPNEANSQDPLTLQTDYEYYATGNLKKETLNAPYGNQGELSRINTYEYGPDTQQRLITKETLRGGTLEYETIYSYDVNDKLESQTECNGLITQYDEDALSITHKTIYPDSTIACQALRWANDCEYAPEKASYYRWERKTGLPKCLSFYHKNGLELRRVSFGLRGEPFFVDKTYDDRDRLLSVTDSYKEGETPQYTLFEYDNINRITARITPDGTRTEYDYDGLSTTTTIVPLEGVAQSSTITKNAAGWVSNSTDASSVTINYGYYSDGTLASSQIGSNAASKIEIHYDHWGNRSQLVDPDYGITSSVYNAYGELVSEESPKHNVTNYSYDRIGRMIAKEDCGENITTYYDYDESTGLKGTLKRIRHGSQIINYTYDDFLRIVKTRETLAGVDYDTDLGYDQASRVCSVQYPSGFSALLEYTPSGYANKVTDAMGNPLWQLDEMNARGQLMQVTLGNGIVTRHTYQEDMHYLDSIITSNNLQNLSYTYDKFGNLAARKDNRRNMTESFTYDDMNRLKTISMGGLTANMTYDGLGRMTSKQAIVGNNRSPQVKQVFTAPVFDATKIHAVSEATTMPGVFPEEDQDIEYTSFDKVSYIQEGDNHLSYSYGFNEQRIGMNEEVDGMIRTKIYTGNCEFVTANGQQKTLTYLTSPYGVFAVVEKQGEDESLHFVLKDHLGSWTVITDENGEVEQEVSFDAWGNLRNPETWTNYSENETYEEPMFDRGFTGHEHLAAFGLINMNGRMYDPMMSSFLSVDRFVQSMDNSQSFNRYAYCLYNPLRYVDPTGWQLGIGDGRPDDPPGLDNYQPGTYNSADSDYACIVCLNEVTVTATSGGAPQSCSNTNYTEGTSWDDGLYYSYFGAFTDAGSNLQESTNGYGGGGGGGGAIGMGSNNLSGNSKLTPSVVNNVVTGAGTITGYQKSLWEKPKSRAQKAINQKKAYNTQKALKAKGITKSVKEIKAGKIAHLKTGGYALGGISLGLEAIDITQNRSLNVSNVVNIAAAIGGVFFWEVGLAYMALEAGSYLITGQSFGENLDNIIGKPIHSW